MHTKSYNVNTKQHLLKKYKFRLTTDYLCVVHASGGSGGGVPRAPPAQNFFIFMQFLGKIGQIIGWRAPPPLGLAPPPLGYPGSATACSVFTLTSLTYFS